MYVLSWSYVMPSGFVFPVPFNTPKSTEISLYDTLTFPTAGLIVLVSVAVIFVIAAVLMEIARLLAVIKSVAPI